MTRLIPKRCPCAGVPLYNCPRCGARGLSRGFTVRHEVVRTAGGRYTVRHVVVRK